MTRRGAGLWLAMENPTLRTIEEISRLKANWLDDESWDIEYTPGFEMHREELRTWRMSITAERGTNESDEVIGYDWLMECQLAECRTWSAPDGHVFTLDRRSVHIMQSTSGASAVLNVSTTPHEVEELRDRYLMQAVTPDAVRAERNLAQRKLDHVLGELTWSEFTADNPFEDDGEPDGDEPDGE